MFSLTQKISALTLVLLNMTSLIFDFKIFFNFLFCCFHYLYRSFGQFVLVSKKEGTWKEIDFKFANVLNLCSSMRTGAVLFLKESVQYGVWLKKNLHKKKILYDIMLYIIQNQLQIQQKVWIKRVDLHEQSNFRNQFGQSPNFDIFYQ